jgi:predicted transposase/invertase (TIGR01784 family)
MIATINPEIQEAVDILYEISADEKVRAEYAARQKAWMDRQSQFDGYFKKGKAEGKVEGKAETARNLKSLGVSTDIIINSTGLSFEEIAKL